MVCSLAILLNPEIVHVVHSVFWRDKTRFNWLKYQQFKSSSFWSYVSVAVRSRNLFLLFFTLWKFQENLIVIERCTKHRYKLDIPNCFKSLLRPQKSQLLNPIQKWEKVRECMYMRAFKRKIATPKKKTTPLGCCQIWFEKIFVPSYCNAWTSTFYDIGIISSHLLTKHFTFSCWVFFPHSLPFFSFCFCRRFHAWLRFLLCSTICSKFADPYCNKTFKYICWLNCLTATTQTTL